MFVPLSRRALPCGAEYKVLSLPKTHLIKKGLSKTLSASQVVLVVKNLPASAGDVKKHERCSFDS